MMIGEIADKFNKLCEEGKAKCKVVCRAGDFEDLGWDKIFDDIDVNFEDDSCIIDFDFYSFIDVKR